MTKFHRIAAVGQALGLAVVALSVLLLVGLGLGPRTGRYRTMTVLTASMRPSIPEGSMIMQTPTALSQLRVGDVITYSIPVEDHRVVTHRVVEVLEGGRSPMVRTKGDANRSPDPWVARLVGDKVWRVRASVPKLGYALQALRQPEAKRVTLILVPLLLALIWLRDIWAPSHARDPVPGPVLGLGSGPPAASVGRWGQGSAALAALAVVAILGSRRPNRG